MVQTRLCTCLLKFIVGTSFLNVTDDSAWNQYPRDELEMGEKIEDISTLGYEDQEHNEQENVTLDRRQCFDFDFRFSLVNSFISL